MERRRQMVRRPNIVVGDDGFGYIDMVSSLSWCNGVLCKEHSGW